MWTERVNVKRIEFGSSPIASKIKARNFSPASETNLLKTDCRLHGEGFSPGRNSARAENPSPVCANRARIFSLGKRARKSEKISCNRNGISARAEKHETIWLPLGSRSDFSRN